MSTEILLLLIVLGVAAAGYLLLRRRRENAAGHAQADRERDNLDTVAAFDVQGR